MSTRPSWRRRASSSACFASISVRASNTHTMLTGSPTSGWTHGCPRRRLIQPLLRTHAAETADVGQSKGEAEQVFGGHVGNRVAAIFHGHAAAIPVVCGLYADELQRPVVCVKAKTAGGTETALDGSSISQRGAKLIEMGSLSRTRSQACLPGDLQDGIAAADGHLADVVVRQQGAGIDAIILEVVIQIPLRV